VSELRETNQKIRVSPALAGGARVRLFRALRIQDFPTLRQGELQSAPPRQFGDNHLYNRGGALPQMYFKKDIP